MNSDERESQLSAMFDGELAAEECELLSRRLGRDDALRSHWSRYALIGAAMRSDPVDVARRGDLARRVRAAISADPAQQSRARLYAAGWWRFALGAGVAASVAAAGILWLRIDLQRQNAALLAASSAAEQVVVPAAEEVRPLIAQSDSSSANVVVLALSDEPESYVVPPAVNRSPPIMPAILATFVVAHSEYSSPLARRNLLSTLVSSEAANTAGMEAGDGAQR